MAEREKQQSLILTEREAVLTQLRDGALAKLLKDGQESTFNSTARRSGTRLDVTTTQDGSKRKTTINVDGEAGAEHTIIPPEVKANGVIAIKDQKGKLLERDMVQFSSSDVDNWFQRDDKFKVSNVRTDATGKVFQQSQGDYNKLDRGYSPTTNATECDYDVHDTRFGSLKLNQTVRHYPNGSMEYRSVIRDQQRHILGIIDQDIRTTANGDITSVTTHARKSKYQGQVRDE